MIDEHTLNVEGTTVQRLETSFRLSTRIAVIESNYASKEYVGEVRWQAVKWLAGVALGSFALGAGVVTLLMRIIA